ncbi:MAG: hypothetical protein INH41_16660 [Myxococcaceae bacterium]|nr:hypothetical protein [Myxococcaceae bacterium]MCA3014014.1 hypothetical protein [Myxococcaceae bacterium]
MKTHRKSGRPVADARRDGDERSGEERGEPVVDVIASSLWVAPNPRS